MKKMLISLFAVSIMFAACKKDEVVEPTQTTAAPTATISGKVYADLDQTNTNIENAPDGINIIATATHNGNTFRYEAKVASGAYSFTIPAVNTGVNVTITPSDFRANKIVNASFTMNDYVWNANPVTVTVLPGQTQMVDFTFN